MQKILVRLLVLAVLAGVVAGGFYLVQQIPEEGAELATAEVRRGDLVIRTFLRGELQAVRSAVLTAPNLGSMSQITRLAPNGALAEQGDLIAEFDDSDRRIFLEDAQIDVEKINQDLSKAATDLEIRKSQDEVELVKAKFAVRRAELDVKQNELISAIDARKNVLSLEEARRRLQKLEQDIQSRIQQREAELAVLREQLRKAQLDAQREERRIEQALVLAPMAGLVSVLENRSGGRGGFGQTTPPIREGDQIPPGLAMVQILDLSEMDLSTKVEEVERANLREGQKVFIRLDALPGKTVHGEVKRLGNTASSNVFRGEATKKFDCTIAVGMKELLESVGASPEQIRRILASAQENGRPVESRASPPPIPVSPGRRAAGPRGRTPGDPSGVPQEEAESGPGAQRRPARPRLSDEQRQQMRQKMQELLKGRDPQSMSREERRQMFQQIRQSMGGALPGGGRGGRPGGDPGDVSARTQAPPAAPQAPQPGLAPPGLSAPAAPQFTEQQRQSAQLPAAPQAGSDVEILLRPGLLADAEIIIESIPEVVHIPYQGVFDIAGQPVVYVREGDRFRPRRVKLGKRAESRIVIEEGLEEGQVIALENPDSSAREKRGRKKAEKKSSSGPALPGGSSPSPAGSGERSRRRPRTR